VGTQGSGVLDISIAGNVLVSGTQGLAIGGDPFGLSGGTVNQSSGTLCVFGNTVLGAGGVGVYIRSGGLFSGTGNLVAAGAGTLVVSGSATTSFGGRLTHSGAGTLVVVPQSGGGAVSFAQSSNLTNNLLGPWAVQQAADGSGDFLTITGGSGSYSLVAASSYATSFGSASVVSVTGAISLGDTSAYAVKFGSGSTTTLNGVLSLGSGGMILNGATLSGSGSVGFGGKTAWYSPVPQRRALLLSRSAPRWAW